ncbi:hypothetical protein CYMTET_10903 [Cymbomonas tetramitiformis]|uniref:Uncharacterized protein n=1 Tax=Cymbomonas tetramitiformis TaxID=36881 RepID=A0AAE0GPR0_9CHLO|nr:hypothetical protein CYMTET_10903 [Cymbomonas tetramitiformis]
MEPCSLVVDEIILAYLFSTGKVATESKTDRQEQQRAERRAQRAIRVSQHFTELEGEEGAAGGQPEAQALVQPEAQAPAQLQAQAQEPLVIFEEDMEYTDFARVNLGTLPNYTGTKEEDRPKFLREFADMCENFVRQHNANVRRRLRSGAGTLTEAQMKTLRETPPDFEYLWDIVPACLAGENSQALSWWRENYERGGVVASNMDRVLKDTSEHGPLEGTIPCARPPFNEMNTGTTWVIARPVTNQDTQGEVSDEYLTDGTSLKGLTGRDGTRDTQYFYALRGFIAALDKKFMMKGTQEKVDLLTQKPQEVGQDGLTYMKMCQRREMQLNTGKVLSDEELRTFIEDCVDNLRIKVFQTRVKEQLRAQFPPPNRVTWKDLEAIVEVQDKLKGDAESWILTFLQEITRRCGCQYSTWEARQHGLDLKAIKNSIKKIESSEVAQSGEPENSKKVDTPPSKKMKKEVNVAERAKKASYNKTPPPAEGVRTNDKPKCLRCFGGGWHESDPEQCRSGYKHVKMPAGFHESRLGSSKWWDAENAALRMYNLKNRFKNSDWGILVTDWQQLSNDEKDKYRAKQSPEDKQKSATGNPEALKAEYQGMVAARKTASRAGSVKSQVLSEDEGSDEEPVAAHVAERETHTVDARAHHHGSAGVGDLGVSAGPPTELLSAMAEEMGEEELSSALNTLGLGALPETLCKNAESELTAAPAVALGSTQRMRGFPVKTPEEYEADAQVPMAPAADEMQRKVQLMASVIKSLGAAFRKLAAGLVAEGRITAPRGVETLVELAENNQLPVPTASAADCQDIAMRMTTARAWSRATTATMMTIARAWSRATTVTKKSPARPSLRSSPGEKPGTQPANDRRAKRTQVCFLLVGVFVRLHWPQLPHFAVMAVWMAMEVFRFLGEVVACWAFHAEVPRRAMARALWAMRAAPLEPWAHQQAPLRVLLELARHLLLLTKGALEVAGLHHARRGLWYVPLLRFCLAMLAMHFTHMVGTLGCVLTVGAHVVRHGLPCSGLICNGGTFATLETRIGRALAVAQRILAAGPATLAAVPRRMQKPRFAARLQRLQFTAACYQVAHCVYVISVLALVVYVSAGGGLGRMQGGWRRLTCILTLHPPVKPVGTSRILKLLLLLAVAAWVAAVAPGEFQGVLAMGSCSGSPTRSIRTAWEDQRSSRQWDTGWEAMVAERDEVLPHTVLDTLQPGGTTRVTKDEAAWLDTELNATFGGHPEFTEENWEEMRNVVRRCSYCFANKPQDIKGYHGGAAHATFAIPFKDETKVAYQRPRKYSPGEQEIIDLHCKELLEYGFIEPASQHCRHASNVVVAGKKDHDTGQWTSTRFCVDLRNTNRLSLKDNTLPHRPEELYQRVAKAKFKTTLDATKAFHQIPMTTEEDRDKTAFWWGNQLYRYTSMPFGAAGATAAFIRIMDYELRHLQHCTVAYVDDVCIYSDTAEQHIKDVEAVLRTLGDAGIRLHSGKSTFGSATVDFLGYRIGYNTIGAQDIKCKAIQELPKPEDKTGVRSILGLMNYYKGLVGEPMGPNYSEMARPLNDLLRKEVLDVKEAWGKDQDQALQALKDALCSGRCLKPIDYSKPIFLYTDWSNHGIGAVLGQKDENGVEHICVVISRSLSKTERQYASFQGEMLAVVWAIRTLRQYLHGIHFTLITDHSPLTTLMEKGDLQGQHLRWAISLQEFEFTVQYRPGPKNENADVPSRYPLPSTADETGARLDREGDRAREAGRAERPTRCFTDIICLEVTREPPLGPEVSPEAQVANYCENMVREQLGTSAVHRLFDVHYQEELECNKGVMFDTDHPEVARCSGRLTRVAWDALSQVRPIRGMHSGGSPAIYGDETMEGGKLKVPKKIDTRVIDKSFFREAREEGVVCYEPCGGLCAGLEMLLRCGVKVNKYLYQDISKSSQTVARARCMALSRRHPDLFRAEAAHLEQLPSNIEDTSLIDLVHAGALSGEQWVMVCGYPCQDLSPAGKLAGLEGRHSRLFYQAVRVLSTLQQLQPQRPPAYVLENVSPLSHRENSKIRKEVFPIINSVVGQPVSFDAARAGSYAHRLRAYSIGAICSKISNSIWVVTGDRKPHYTANVVGEPMRVLPTILATQNSRAFRAPRAGTVVRKGDDDEVGETREVNLDEKAVAMGYSAGELRAAHGMEDEELAGVLGLAMDRRAMELFYAIAEVSTTKLPKSEESEEEEHGTLVAIPIAKATKVAATSEGTAEPVRAQLAEWITSSSGYTQQVARRLSHQDWEERLQRMCSQGQKGTQGLGTADAVPRRRQWKMASMKLAGYEARHRQAFSRPGGKPAETSSAPEWAPVTKEKEMRLPKLPDTTRMVAMLASVTNQESLRERYPDIHEDELCLAWVKTGGRVEVPKEEYHRVRKRAARHRWDELMGELYMVTVSGKELLVPKPCDRIQLVREYHERTGHWGIRRTLNLLWQRHYWAGMKQDVQAVVTQCQTCQRVKTHYAREEANLTPLEIKSFMYRWSLDLAWPTKRITKAGNQRVLVMIEHYTRFVVCVPIPDKEAATIASAFRYHVLSVFGAPAECLVDGGTEFEGEFSALCKQCLIDRRVTSPSSPESNGLTERVVRTLKFCFKKMALDKGLDFEWDEMLWSLVLSYNAARQQSTGVAPFTLLFAQEATVPPDLRARPELDFGKQEEKTLADDLLQRAAIVKRLMVHAGCNLEIAQHRDTLRYEHRRSGSYEPKPHQFKAGDFVYIRQQPRSGMEVATKPAILKIVKVQRDGVVVLEDSTKLREKSTVQNIAPCHLQVKDQYDCSAAIPSKHLACEACMRTDGEAAMLLCDTCNRGYHTWCLNPALDGVPEGDWQCPKCLGGTVVAAAAEVSASIVDKMAAMELQLREKLGSDVVLLPADVGPHRAVRPGREDPWQALTSRQMLRKEGSMGDLPDRVAWGNQEELSRAMSPEEVQKRGDVTQLSRAQVKIASQLDWGLELVMTVPQEVRRLAHEVTWEKITQVWDPWAGTGVIGKVMSLEWPHLKVMNNDWNPQLKWHEALNALQPGNYRAWKEKYGVCDAVVTSPWFAVLDIALPLAVLASRVVACIHVPSHYMTDMTESRAQYFRKLCHAGRLHVIGHLEHGPIGRRCMWVMVFRNPLTRARMLRGGEASGVGMFTFSMGKFAMDGVTTEDAEQALV